MIEVLNFELNELNMENVLRYMGQRDKKATKELMEKLYDAETKLRAAAKPRLCYLETEKYITGFESLDEHLKGCNRVVYMAATIGNEADRLRKKAAVISPVMEMIYDALGTEAIEQVCDRFCERLKEKYGDITFRYSPGYGDYPLEEQKKLVVLLEANKKIGVGLTDSLLMTPTKSVTAVVGIKE